MSLDHSNNPKREVHLPELVKEVSLSSCPGIGLEMALTFFWPIICKRKISMWLPGKVSLEIKRADGRKCSSSCCMPLCLQKKAGTLLANMWPQVESTTSNTVTQKTWVPSLGWEDPLEKEMATHFSILAWPIPWMEEPGGVQSTGSQRVGHDWTTSLSLSEVSETILSSFHSFYFILLFRSYFHHFIFQLADSSFWFKYSAIASF